jgi:ADP-heptose:LPS heptosyltransferase
MRFLLIRLSSIGDIVLSSAAIRCLRKQYPEAAIDFLTKAPMRGILAADPHLNNIITWEGSPKEMAQTILHREYTHIIDLQDNIRTRLLEQWLPGRIHVLRYDKLRWRRTLSVWLKRNIYRGHVAEQYIEALSPIGVNNDGLGLAFYIAPEDQISMKEVPFTHKAGFAVLCIGATHFTKRMPEQKWAELIQKIRMPLMLIGGPAEQALGDRLAEIDSFKVINRCGQYSIGQSASAIHLSKFVITQDTGMMHIAAAFNKKTLSIWGGTIPELGFYPYLRSPENNIIIEQQELGCRPCSKYGRNSCPRRHFRCMEQINIDTLILKTGIAPIEEV